MVENATEKENRKPRRSAAQLARDRQRIAGLYLEGKLQADIAEMVGVSQSTVSNDLKAIQQEWLQSSLVDFNEARAREIAKIDKLEREYYAAWQRSCEDAETVTKKAVQVGDKERKEATQTAKGQAGDPRFLQGVQWCIERRCKLFGIDAAQRHELTGALGNIDLAALSVAQLERLSAGDDPLKVLLMEMREKSNADQPSATPRQS